MAAGALILIGSRNHDSRLRAGGARARCAHLSVVALRCLLHVVGLDELVFTLIIILPHILRLLLILQRIKAPRMFSSPLIIIALCSRLALVLIIRDQLVRKLRRMLICTRMILFA